MVDINLPVMTLKLWYMQTPLAQNSLHICANGRIRYPLLEAMYTVKYIDEQRREKTEMCVRESCILNLNSLLNIRMEWTMPLHWYISLVFV